MPQFNFILFTSYTSHVHVIPLKTFTSPLFSYSFHAELLLYRSPHPLIIFLHYGLLLRLVFIALLSQVPCTQEVYKIKNIKV